MTVSKDWEFQKSWLRKVYNKEVNEWFHDTPEPEPDNSTSRKSAKRSCLILPKDGQNKTLIKMMTFRYCVQQVHLRPNIYGIPVEQYQEDVSFKPHVHLYFRQDSAAVPDGEEPITGQCSFRLVNETSSTMTETKAQSLAAKIKTHFALNKGYIWKKGKVKVTVKDAENGLNLGILALNETEGTDLVKAIYAVTTGSYDDDKVVVNNPKRNSVNTRTGTRTVFGKQKKNKRWRPTANVRFTHATLTMDGMPTATVLVDRTGQYYAALESV